MPAQTEDAVIACVQNWIEKAVIGLNLCPFAKAVHVKNQIRYVVSKAQDSDALLAQLKTELQTLHLSAATEIDTTILIHPDVLNDFLAYNDFLQQAEAAIEGLNLQGEIQIASFHPQYQFADTHADDIENYTNRSPYPILHLLREASIDRAVAAFPDAESIFEQNIATMRALGHHGWQALALMPPAKT
jgi:hypothetical protein